MCVCVCALMRTCLHTQIYAHTHVYMCIYFMRVFVFIYFIFIYREYKDIIYICSYITKILLVYFECTGLSKGPKGVFQVGEI